jgi:hypothetical protein
MDPWPFQKRRLYLWCEADAIYDPYVAEGNKDYDILFILLYFPPSLNIMKS